MIEKDLSHEHYTDQLIKNWVSQLDIWMELNYKFFDVDNCKQYGNTMDPDGEYEIRFNQGTIDLADMCKQKLIKMGQEIPEKIESIVTSLLDKNIPDDKPKYVLSRTETRFQMLTPEPANDSEWTWISGSDTKKVVDEIILSFGSKALSILKEVNSTRSKELISKIKRQEFRKKVSDFFKSP